MNGFPATYLGKIVDKTNFRVFIYGIGGAKKLVESWDEYERFMETGLWFATLEEVDSPKVIDEPLVMDEPVIEKPKRGRKAIDKDDDFLPKAGD